MTVSKDKQYKTRGGMDARIYATDGGGDYPIHGAFYSDGRWLICKWREEDLTEVKPEISGYINIYEHPSPRMNQSLCSPNDVGYLGNTVFSTRNDADYWAKESTTNINRNRIACIPVTFHEGEGLE